ncbi:hypothetical protein ACFY78_18835 [Streptomyces olindensis]|uniref:hypothetical protein n=1 Tax=Streptomyces olindensis TaxID=358823 RepID=UPI0036CDEFE9
MAPEPEQIPSRTCGCRDCLIDLPPERYGQQPPHDACTGPWRVRYHNETGKHRAKNLPTLRDAQQFLATVQPKAVSRAS